MGRDAGDDGCEVLDIRPATVLAEPTIVRHPALGEDPVVTDVPHPAFD